MIESQISYIIIRGFTNWDNWNLQVICKLIRKEK